MMDQKEAIGVLIQAANMAQNKGVFNLQEASAVATAVSTFVAPPETTSKEEESDSAEEANE
jgi:hypothetical protein